MKPQLSLIALLFLVGFVTFPAVAEENDTPLKITHVALFKNGLGYFHSSATLPDATTVRFGQLPIPSHGTFWLGYDPKLPVTGTFTSLEQTTTSRAPTNISELLAAHVGQAVTVFMSNDDKPPVHGKLLSVQTAELPEPLSPYVMSSRTDNNARRNYYGGYNSIAMIQTGDDITAVHTASILRCTIGHAAGNKSFTETKQTPSIRLTLSKPAPGQTVAVSYLAKGITWAPSYLIDLDDPTKAAFTAKAVLINEAADMTDVSVDLVTGFPNLQFADIQSPIGLSQNLEQFLNALRGQPNRRNDYGVMAQQAMVMSNAPVYREAGPQPNYGAADAGQTAEDLFLYPIPKISIKRGETATVPLFTQSMPYEHVYTWKIADMLDEQDRYRRDQDDRNAPHQEEVWHVCRLTNAGKLPLTTAPAMFVKSGQMVGQDICYFTSPGDKTDIRINRAMRVAADQGEFEVSRERNSARYYGYQYDKVTVRGELKVISHAPEKIKLEVTRDLSGDVTENKDNAQVIDTAKGLRAVNARHQLIWKIDLDPGKPATLTYQYTVLIRS